MKLIKLLILLSILYNYNKINCEKITTVYNNAIVYVSIYGNSSNSNSNGELQCIANLECNYYNGGTQFGSSHISKNSDNSCNSTFDFTGYTDFQSQKCIGTKVYMISNRVDDDKIEIPISFPIVIDSSELLTNGSSMLKLRYYGTNGETPMTIRDITGALITDIHNLTYTNSHIFNSPGTLTWTMSPGFGYVTISFGGESNLLLSSTTGGNSFKITYPKPIISSSRVVSLDIEKGITQIEFQGMNFGNNKRLITFLPNCYPFPYKITVDYVNSTYLLISDHNKLKSVCPSRDFRYSICLDTYCNSGSLKEGYPPISINSIEGPSANRTYQFNGYFLNSTTFSQMIPTSQYGIRLSSSIYDIEFQMNSPTYYQYNGNRSFKFWDKNANTSISIPIESSDFKCGPPSLNNTVELKDAKQSSLSKLQVNGEYLTYDMNIYLDGIKLNSTVVTIENSTMFYIQPIPRPGILTVCSPVKEVNSSLSITIKLTIEKITVPPTSGGLITIVGSGLYLKSENGQPLKTKLTIENFGDNNLSNCLDPIENPNYPAGTSIICKVEPGVGSKLDFYIEIGSSKIVYSKFSYQPPSLTSITQHYDKAIVSGNNLGEHVKVYIYIGSSNSIPNSNLVIVGGATTTTTTATATSNNKLIVQPIQIITNNSNSIEFIIPDNLKTSLMYIEVGGQRSNSKQLVITPIITSIASNQVPVNGGLLTIVGKFLNIQNYNYRDDSIANIRNKLSGNGVNSNLHIKIGNINCKDITQQIGSGGNSKPTSTGSSITCKMPSGSGCGYPVSIYINDTMLPIANPNNIKFSYMPPTILNSTSASPSEGGLITIYGTQLTKPINVTIDSQPCIYINVTDSYSLTCYLPASNEQLTKSSIQKSTHPILITVNGQSSDANIFKYSTPSDSYNYKQEDNDNNENQKNPKWLIPAILIPCLFFLIAIIVLIIVYIRKYRKRKEIQRKLNEPIPSE